MLKSLEEHSLLEELEKLLAENRQLQKRLAFFENHPAIAKGLHADSFIAKLLGGDLTHPRLSSDMRMGELLVKIRFSTVKTPHANSLGSRRWSWPDVIEGPQRYDRLILIGVPDEGFRERYLDPECSYVLFDLPYDEVETVSQISGPHRNIHLITDPQIAQHAFSGRLFTRFQITEEELEALYEL
jgi:hypothetical protein